MTRPVDDYATPIGTGLTPADSGRLSATRAAELHRRLAELRRARQQAAVEMRGYLVAERVS